jgi:hypothetical protein
MSDMTQLPESEPLSEATNVNASELRPDSPMDTTPELPPPPYSELPILGEPEPEPGPSNEESPLAPSIGPILAPVELITVSIEPNVADGGATPASITDVADGGTPEVKKDAIYFYAKGNPYYQLVR